MKERQLLEAKRIFREKTMFKENETITKKDTRYYELLNTLDNIKF